MSPCVCTCLRLWGWGWAPDQGQPAKPGRTRHEGQGPRRAAILLPQEVEAGPEGHGGSPEMVGQGGARWQCCQGGPGWVAPPPRHSVCEPRGLLEGPEASLGQAKRPVMSSASTQRPERTAEPGRPLRAGLGLLPHCIPWEGSQVRGSAGGTGYEQESDGRYSAPQQSLGILQEMLLSLGPRLTEPGCVLSAPGPAPVNGPCCGEAGQAALSPGLPTEPSSSPPTGWGPWGEKGGEPWAGCSGWGPRPSVSPFPLGPAQTGSGRGSGSPTARSRD